MKYRKGITILELVLALALFSIAIIPATNFFIFGNRVQSSTISEFDTQSKVRLVSENINSIIRDATGLYLLNKVYPSDDSIEAVNASDYFSDNWNYLMLNSDGTEFVEWVWDGTKHIKKTIVAPVEGLSYNLTYTKENPSNEDNLLKYDLNINVTGKERDIKTELTGLNTLQVIDRSYGKIANTLSYRYDSRLDDIGMAQAAVSFVIDTSNSMNKSIAGGTRIGVLKSRAKEMVAGLAENENVWLSLTPFNTTANPNDNNMLNNMKPLKETERSGGISNVIDALGVDGGTNTGDGMRRGYYSIVDFNSLVGNEDKITKNFMIILVDGETTFATGMENITRDHKESGFLILSKPSVTLNGRIYHYYDTSSFFGFRTHTYRYNEYDSNKSLIFYTESSGDVSNINTIGTLPDNEYYSGGRVFGPGNSTNNEVKAYVTKVGEKIYKYKEKTDGAIEVFVIGFAGDANDTDLQHIASSTQATHGTHGSHANYRYYKADTSEALKTILDEIKFQVSEALWHIGGPN